MKKWIAVPIALYALLFIFGCSHQRLSEDEYARRAIDAYRQERLDDAWIYYRMLVQYYPESSKAEQYRSQLTEVLAKLAQQAPQHLRTGYLNELKLLGCSDTLMAWLKFQTAMKIEDATKAKTAFKEITYTEYLLAAQYAINRMRFRDALNAYDKAAEIYPDDPKTYKSLFLAGFVASEYLKDKTRAKQYYTRVVENYPQSDLADDAQWMLKNMDNPPDKITFIVPDSAKGK